MAGILTPNRRASWQTPPPPKPGLPANYEYYTDPTRGGTTGVRERATPAPTNVPFAGIGGGGSGMRVPFPEHPGEFQARNQASEDAARSRQQGMVGTDQAQRLQQEQWGLQSRLGEAQLAGLKQRGALQARLADQYSNALRGLMSGGGGSPYTPPGGGGGGAVSYGGTPSVSPINTAAESAQSAQFGQAKARAGAMGRSALESLRAELADRNMLGSGAEAQGTVDLLAGATNPLSDLNVAQLGENVGIAQHNQDLQAQAAANQFQGGIAQRGQDIQAGQFAADLAQRKREQQQQIISQALSGLTRMF